MGNPLGLRADPSVVDAVLRLAARQHSLLSRRQWLDGGLSQRQLDGALAKAALVVVHPGVYAVRGSRSSYEREVLAACLATGGVAAHHCAAYLWKFRRFECPVLEVLVAAGKARGLPRVTVRRTRRLGADERTRLGALPVTTRARTLFDLASVAAGLVEGALDGTLHRRQLSLRAVQRSLERVSSRHPAHVLLSPLVATRLAGRRPTESELEDDLLALMRRHGLPEPVPQYPCHGRRIDFAYPDLMIGIDAQSVLAHAAKEDVQRNAEKANDLLEWWILYFTHDDVHAKPLEVVRRIGERGIAGKQRSPNGRRHEPGVKNPR